MISQWFAPPKKQAHVYNLPAPTRGVPESDVAKKAAKLGLDVFEYNKRCRIVAQNSRQFSGKTGDEMWPSLPVDQDKYGKMRILRVCQHYDDYGQVNWNEDNPLIVSAQCIDKPNHVLNCSIGWLTFTEPKQISC